MPSGFTSPPPPGGLFCLKEMEEKLILFSKSKERENVIENFIILTSGSKKKVQMTKIRPNFLAHARKRRPKLSAKSSTSNCSFIGTIKQTLCWLMTRGRGANLDPLVIWTPLWSRVVGGALSRRPTEMVVHMTRQRWTKNQTDPAVISVYRSCC